MHSVGSRLNLTFWTLIPLNLALQNYQVIDATQSDTKELVAIKSFAKDSQEKDVAQLLSSLDDPQNHCVRILGILEDPLDASLAMMVMPYLRPCDNPDFGTVGDVIQFVDQTVEGLAFMHRHRIAHRDIAMKNIMMDGKALFPDGHHPVRLNYSPDAIYKVNPLPRAGRSIQYFYIDFGLAFPYDAFKMDIFAPGNLYAKEFEQKYNDMQFLIPMIERMKQRQPELRPTAEEVYNQWIEIRDSLNKNTSRWRLSPRSEAAIGRMLNDTVAVAWEGISHLKKYVT
ncbi:hypothetical protein GY45DRAFT_1374426 [Cubamyces sp. BRFM 1775]|nr:hypothetical protein GY45DRAFT_1374426 [Cubamyces sp. BRFM 1775]